MGIREIPVHKALYFDMRIKELAKYYSESNPKGGYARVKRFMNENKFEHEQYSGYHSEELLTDMQVLNLVFKMQKELPWVGKCMRKFEVSNIGDNYNLMQVFEEEPLNSPEN